MDWRKFRKSFLTGCRILPAANAMKHRRQIIASLLVAFTLGSNARAQDQPQTQLPHGDWQVVRNLTPGKRISVKTHHRYRCSVEEVTDDELVCREQALRPFRTVTLAIRRSEIREVRVRAYPNQAKDAWIGAGIGAGAGAIAAGTTSRDYPGFHAFVGGVAGAGGGALVGATVPIFQVLFQRGKIIYKR